MVYSCREFFVLLLFLLRRLRSLMPLVAVVVVVVVVVIVCSSAQSTSKHFERKIPPNFALCVRSPALWRRTMRVEKWETPGVLRLRSGNRESSIRGASMNNFHVREVWWSWPGPGAFRRPGKAWPLCRQNVRNPDRAGSALRCRAHWTKVGFVLTSGEAHSCWDLSVECGQQIER